MADPKRKVIDLWIRETATVGSVTGTLAHEVGHLLDFTTLQPADRQHWLQLRGLEIDWWPGCTCNDRSFGAGDLAESLVVLVAGHQYYTGRYAIPNQRQLDWLAGLVINT